MKMIDELIEYIRKAIDFVLHSTILIIIIAIIIIALFAVGGLYSKAMLNLG